MDSKLKIPPEIIAGPDTPEEYRFSNPGPSDPPKRNFWIDEGGAYPCQKSLGILVAGVYLAEGDRRHGLHRHRQL